MDYQGFLNKKRQEGADAGFAPLWMPDFVFDFQQSLVEWALLKGRGAIFADCGLGKAPMSLVWASNVVQRMNGRVLILTPLAVSYQFVREGEKFSIPCHRAIDGKPVGEINVTNYERLHHFDPADYEGVVCDESSIIKNFDGKTKAMVTEFLRTIRYRLLCTATAAPNDYFELGTSSEALGYLGFQDMLTRFFKQDTQKDHLGWGRTTYLFRGHAEQPFWRWVCSWARSCRRPSDLGFEDGDFVLPELIQQERIIETSKPRAGMLFPIPARTLEEQREERRNTIRERCEAAAEIASATDRPSVTWCHLNAEGDLLAKLIPGALQVSGSMSDDQKEERLLAFQSGELKRLVIKPRIGAFGLNWQNCSDIITFPSHSWEQHYQSIRRCYRFGQTRPVQVTIITTEGERSVLNSLRRKADQADRMFDQLCQHMAGAMHIDSSNGFHEPERMPSWLSSSK